METCTVITNCPTRSNFTAFDDIVKQWIFKNKIKGATIALMKDSKLKYVQGYGFANTEKQIPALPKHRFRLASVSKPITGVTISFLLQSELIHLDDFVFGESGILNHLKPIDGNWGDSRLFKITISDLLHHRGGWDSDETQFDPMFQTERIAKEMKQPGLANQENIICYMLSKSLQFDPGSKFVYSNFGYCVLGRVVEKVTSMSYAQYVLSHILEPLGIHGIEQGCTKVTLPDEVTYYSQVLVQSIFMEDKKQLVPNCYGGFSLEVHDAGGAWIANVYDLMRFVKGLPLLLEQNTIDNMVDRPENDEGLSHWYGHGWGVRYYSGTTLRNYWHHGGLDGTSTILVHSERFNISFAMLMNSRDVTESYDKMLWGAIETIKVWPVDDMWENL